MDTLKRIQGKDSYSFDGFVFIRKEDWQGIPLYVPVDYRGWPDSNFLENPVARIGDKDLFSYKGMVFSRDGRDICDIDFSYRGWCRLPSDKKRVDYEGVVYIPDPMLTSGKEHDPKRDSLERLKKELSIMKGAIQDDSLPARLSREIFMDTEERYLIGLEEFGRDYIIRLVGRVKLQDAYPELKHVMYHDPDFRLRVEAMEATKELGGKRAANAISGKLRDVNEHIDAKMLAAGMLSDLPYKENVAPLTRTYYETEEMRPSSDSEQNAILSGMWLPLKCVAALAAVPSLSSLEGLERAARSRFCENEYAGRVSLKYWIALNREMLSRLPDNYEAGERKRLLNKLERKYDLMGPVEMSEDKPWLCDRNERDPHVINV